MKTYYGVNELRDMFLKFFESKGHLVAKSFSLVPHNDNSLLLINSGMAPLKPYFTGQEIPPCKRMATCQKCIRTGDVDNVGKDGRHGTFFEMLGNFSFGDYFKTEAIHWSWEFLTQEVGLEAERLYPSVYVDDNEAFRIWEEEMGIPKERIYKFGKEDNFWEHGSGPCGPCSEIYYDRGEKYGCGKPDCQVGCDCDRFMEVWNNVFTQFDNDGQNHYTELETKNIDTGMGLERLALAVQDKASIFDIDTICALREEVCQIANANYGESHEKDVSIRIITDHVRSVTFMVSDGILPSNEGRGYVLRRLLRRACRHGRLLDIEGNFLGQLCLQVIAGSKDGYPALEEKKEFILKIVNEEEEKFNKTIDQGFKIVDQFVAGMEAQGKKVLSGEDTFRLYDTYGFPMDLTKEIMDEKGYTVDEDGFNTCMQKAKEIARGSWHKTNYMGADATVYEEIDPSITTEFVGYDMRSCDSKITVLTTETELVEALSDGDRGTVFVEQTTFYAASGGQEADKGIIKTPEGTFRVDDTIKLLGGRIGHVGQVTEGMIKVGDEANLTYDLLRRELGARNHSATHLLHKALNMVLGGHVEQAGSLVSADRLRFDFTHFSALTQEEIQQVEDIVNDEIEKALPVTVQTMPIDEARKLGAQALFGEKYGSVVRVVEMSDFSIELCGGTHVNNTAAILAFKILSESGVAAGVRRIEAVTSKGVFKYYKELETEFFEAARTVKSTPEQLVTKLKSMMEDNRAQQSEIESLKSKQAKESMGDVSDKAIEISGIKLLAIKVDGVDVNGLRELGDHLKDKHGDWVILIGSATGDKAILMATATEGAILKGAHAGNLIKGIAGLIGGGGGGRPNMAQAGGTNVDGIQSALEKAKDIVKEQLGA